MNPETAECLRMALGEQRVQDRYLAKIVAGPDGCLYWTGAISAKGHGRFWIAPNGVMPGRGFVIIAHRFGYALAHGWQKVMATEVLAHSCDNPLCQNPCHLTPSTATRNTNRAAASRGRKAGKSLMA